jgi:ADP-heptose:LPS heptosyltransferase
LLGSGIGWGLERFSGLIGALDPERWQVLVTGTKTEAERYRSALPLDLPHVTDTGGRLDLEGMIQLIGASDAFVSASTGPLHIAAAAGIRAIGLFSMRRPIFPARWAPIGTDVHALVFDPACASCAAAQPCDCITRIPVDRVLAHLPGV